VERLSTDINISEAGRDLLIKARIVNERILEDDEATKEMIACDDDAVAQYWRCFGLFLNGGTTE